MNANEILDFMDASIDNARACQEILENKGFDTDVHQASIDGMVVARAKFYEAHQKELR